MDDWLNEARIQELWVLLDILIAIALTGIIGFEREMRKKPAGFKTNMLVGASAALLVATGQIMVDEYETPGLVDHLSYDPLRLIQAIVVGVSFIGAGTILKSEGKEQIRYLSSAATILLSAGVGIAVSTQKYILAVGLTVIVFCINRIIGRIERRFGNRNESD